MKTKPILFSSPMVRAILNGTKTQTRREVKPQPSTYHDEEPYWFIGGYRVWRHTGTFNTLRTGGKEVSCPFGDVGDRLWVRETFALEHQVETDQKPPHNDRRPIKYEGYEDDYWVQPHYRATDETPHLAYEDMPEGVDHMCRWRPSIHMPRWASRITLEITKVRVQRLNEISDEDALAEGIQKSRDEYGYQADSEGRHYSGDPIESFAGLWEFCYGDGSWEANPLVWVIEFKRVDV